MTAAGNNLMKYLSLKKVNQVGIVVKNIKNTIHYYSQIFGMYPWYRGNFDEHQKVVYRGRKTGIVIEIAMTYCGPVQIELIEPKKGESIYTEHLERNGEGLHHLGFFIDNYDKRFSCLEDLGINILQSGEIKTGGGSVTRYAYLDTVKTGGVILELIESRFLGLPVKMTEVMMKIGCLTGNARRINPY